MYYDINQVKDGKENNLYGTANPRKRNTMLGMAGGVWWAGRPWQRGVSMLPGLVINNLRKNLWKPTRPNKALKPA
jgi:hypothetical protein